MFEVSITSFHTSPESFREAQYGFVDWLLVPYQLQNFLELIDVLRLGLKWLVAFKHSSPDMIVQRVEVSRVWRQSSLEPALPCVPLERWSRMANRSAKRNLGIKISHSCWEIAFCPVGILIWATLYSLSHKARSCLWRSQHHQRCLSYGDWCFIFHK